MTGSPPRWRPAPSRLELGGDVHVWRAWLGQDTSEIARLATLLSPDERRRAASFHTQPDRNRYIYAHGVLRDILGRYLGSDPCSLRFHTTANGKPELASRAEGEGLRFNMSHSGDLAIYAVTRDREVGVDVERMRPDLAVMDLARRFFAPQEVATLEGLPETLRRQAYFACWTRKEAYIKAKGKGLLLALSSFAVSVAPGDPAALLHVRDDATEPSRWTLQALDPGPGYAGALAARGGDWGLVCYDVGAERGG